MARRIRKRKCKNCNDLFPPDPRNLRHHEYCKKPECRKASKAASQKKWLAKEENQHYFRGPLHVERVQRWRKDHPGYWPPKPSQEPEPLQDLSSGKAEENPSIETSKSSPPHGALQDLFHAQAVVMIGLIAHFTDSRLQDDIALTAQRLQQLGSDILYGPTRSQGA